MEQNRLLRFVEISTPTHTVQKTPLWKKIITIKKFNKCSLFVKSRKKLSPMMNEKTRCNTLFESPCI